MTARRIASGDQRRRRVLIEEKLAENGSDERRQRRPPAPATGAGPAASRRSYDVLAEARFQPPSVAVLAVRGSGVIVQGLLSACVLTALLAVYGHIQLETFPWLPRQATSLDLAARGSVACWFSSLCLAAAAFQGIQIYRLRRHKVDDYRGRYRVWTWLPLVFLGMSVGAATGLHHDLAVWAVRWIQGADAWPLSLWMPLGLALLWTLLCLRLGVEVRRCWPALLLLASATTGYFAVAMLDTVEPLPQGPIVHEMARSLALHYGHLAVFLAVSAYGRHVYLDAQGRLPQSPSAERVAAEQADAAESAADAQVDGGEGNPAEAAGQAAADEAAADKADATPPQIRAAASQDAAAEDDEEASGEDETGLSKSERRRLRKQQQQQQQRRQQLRRAA